MFINGPIPLRLIERASQPSDDPVGASIYFIGKVRPDNVNGLTVKFIEFTAQKELSQRIAREIIEFSKKNYGIFHAEIWHSLGKINAGKPCFAVTVSGKHRLESFNALQYIVDEVKRQCPVFGKEIFNDGTYQWKTIKESADIKE